MVLVYYSASQEPHPASVVIQSAVPEDGRWVLRGFETEDPQHVAVEVRTNRISVELR
ncbi:hypothetical protein [Kribbella sp. HUAS MG21]|uniref:WYL domain-containing protein n=1 Tax=Kribbella sp. HUAS MG21 TaxID=3160966 RepID=A0AAU7TGE2_9ACTN